MKTSAMRNWLSDFVWSINRPLYIVPSVILVMLLVLWHLDTTSKNELRAELMASCDIMKRSADVTERTKAAARVLARTRAVPVWNYDAETRTCIDGAASLSVSQ